MTPATGETVPQTPVGVRDRVLAMPPQLSTAAVEVADFLPWRRPDRRRAARRPVLRADRRQPSVPARPIAGRNATWTATMLAPPTRVVPGRGV